MTLRLIALTLTLSLTVHSSRALAVEPVAEEAPSSNLVVGLLSSALGAAGFGAQASAAQAGGGAIGAIGAQTSSRMLAFLPLIGPLVGGVISGAAVLDTDAIKTGDFSSVRTAASRMLGTAVPQWVVGIVAAAVLPALGITVAPVIVAAAVVIAGTAGSMGLFDPIFDTLLGSMFGSEEQEIASSTVSLIGQGAGRTTAETATETL